MPQSPWEFDSPDEENGTELSPRQLELLELLTTTAEPMKQIAHRMCVTEGTCKIYAYRLFTKLGANSRLELMKREITRLRTQLASKAQ